MCKASVIIPAYNAEAYIEKTIESVINQSFSDFEIIVVNDGSTDLTEEKVKAAMLRDERIRLISQPNSGGPAKPRNTGIENAKGEYIFIFDADDLMLEGKLGKSVDCMEQNPTANLLFTNFSTIDAKGKVLNANFLSEYDTLWKITDGQEKSFHLLPAEKVSPALVRVNFIGTSSVVLRKSALAPSDRFNESLKNSDDRLFWILFSMRNDFILLNEILHQYRILPGSISNQGFIRRGPSKIRALEIVAEHLNDTNLKSVVFKQIAKDYATLAYGYKRKGDFRGQRKNALLSLKYSPSFKAIKLLIQSVFRG